jgi:hypothetical protein
MREHDCLDAVAQAQLLEDVGDVKPARTIDWSSATRTPMLMSGRS